MSLLRAKKQKYQPFPGFPGIPEILKDKLLGGFKGLQPLVSVRGRFTVIVIEELELAITQRGKKLGEEISGRIRKGITVRQKSQHS